MTVEDYKRFQNITFDDFRRMATDESLSCYEKIGFPDSYRKGKERAIFEDIQTKLNNLKKQNQTVMDIGPGCSELPLMLIDLCRRNEHRLILIDSEEMLSQLPDEPFVEKVAACYPKCEALFDEFNERIDAMLSYSVLHYIFAEASISNFVHRSLTLLSHGGEILIGDVPNLSKRQRFFASPAGIRFHQEFAQTSQLPELCTKQSEAFGIDDEVILSVIKEVREQGFDAYVVPQPAELPMANRREDMLIRRP